MDQSFKEVKQSRIKNFSTQLFFLILFFSVFKLQAQVEFGAPGSNSKKNHTYADWQGWNFKGWKYHEGDDKHWRAVDWNDNDWQEIKIDTAQPLSISNVRKFKGIGWFRMHFEIDSSMINVPLVMSVTQYGAMEVYLDGKFLRSFGLVGKDKTSEQADFITNARKPFAFTFNAQTQHVMAIRYSNFTAEKLNRKYAAPFVEFEINVAKINDLVPALLILVDFVFELGILAAILLTLGFVHFILFLFYKEKKQNLYYSIYSLALSLLIFAGMFLFITPSFRFAGFIAAFMVYILPVIPLALIALLYEIFYGRMLKFFKILFVISIVYMIFHFYRSGFEKIAGSIILMASAIEIYRIIIKAIAKKKEGAGIFGIGFLYIPFFFFIIMIIGLVTHFSSSNELSVFFKDRLSPVMFFLALISISISMTFYLARDFAHANKKLKRQIDEIKELSEKSMQQETEKKRILENQNLELEKKVAERTSEVLKQNEMLETTLENLRDTQVQLVHSEKMASLGQLTAGVAHEINNPINFVSANISPLKRNFEELVTFIKQKKEASSSELDYTIDETKQLLSGIEEGSRRTAEIVKVLRNFSRLDEEDMKKANVNEGINSTLMLLQNKIKHQHIEVVKSLDDLPEIECYPGQLNQVFMNIISNAIDAIGENGKITVASAIEKKYIKISIRDTGKGMSHEIKQKIFDPFFTTKDVGKGTGLGLSISYGIVEKHNGKIEVESEEGKGTEFNIILPV
jgi:signal transduction histidine kinase